MGNDQEKKIATGFSLPLASTSDLKGKQSVRATFRLSAECIEAISIVANQMGIKQKSLFDHLAEDIKILESIAHEVQNTALSTQRRVQKTFVISRKSLAALDAISKIFNAPRDALVECSIQRLLPIIKREQKKHAKRKEFLARINTHFSEGKAILNDIRKQLGNDDLVFLKFASVMAGYDAAKANLDAFVDRSRAIEKFDSEGLSP